MLKDTTVVRFRQPDALASMPSVITSAICTAALLFRPGYKMAAVPPSRAEVGCPSDMKPSRAPPSSVCPTYGQFAADSPLESRNRILAVRVPRGMMNRGSNANRRAGTRL
jgi:hypothetical protein